jgi:hypothetical protein
MQPTGQKANADDGIPLPVPLKSRVNAEPMEAVTIESMFQPFLIPLRPSGSADTMSIHSDIPLASISLA